MSRIRAAGIHFLCSIVVALLCGGLIFGLAYPWPVSVALGVIPVFLMLLGIDVTIGPFLTLLVFNPKKKELKWDLLVIVVLQILALLYGLHAIYVARPVYMVFNTDRFDLVLANDLKQKNITKVKEEQFRHMPLLGMHVVAAKRPEDAQERGEILFSALNGGDDLPQMPQYYVSYKSQKSQVLAKLLPLKQLFSYNKGNEEYLSELLKIYPEDKYGFLPLRGKDRDLTAIVKKDDGTVVALKNLNPWK